MKNILDLKTVLKQENFYLKKKVIAILISQPILNFHHCLNIYLDLFKLTKKNRFL